MPTFQSLGSIRVSGPLPFGDPPGPTGLDRLAARAAALLPRAAYLAGRVAIRAAVLLEAACSRLAAAASWLELRGYRAEEAAVSEVCGRRDSPRLEALRVLDPARAWRVDRDLHRLALAWHHEAELSGRISPPPPD